MDNTRNLVDETVRSPWCHLSWYARNIFEPIYTKVKEFVVVRFTGICGLRRLLILLIFGQVVVISTTDQSSGVESGSPCLCILETQYI